MLPVHRVPEAVHEWEEHDEEDESDDVEQYVENYYFANVFPLDEVFASDADGYAGEAENDRFSNETDTLPHAMHCMFTLSRDSCLTLPCHIQS